MDMNNGETIEMNATNEFRLENRRVLESKNMYNVWESLLVTNSSNPPTSGGCIYDPSAYESSYVSSNQSQIVLWNQSYNITSDFTVPNSACAPTAATNIFLWWYNKDSSKYYGLYDSNNWVDAYQDIYTDMETTGSSTLTYKLPTGYMRCFNDKGISYSELTLDTNVTKSDIENQTKPFHYCVYGHYNYGNHSLVGVGYEIYNYSNGYSSVYVRVADGFSRSANRFVHNGVGLSDTDMVKICLN